MRAWPAIVACALLGWRPALADCTGPPHNELDFWLGAWHDPAAPEPEHYTVRRTAGGCAVEETLIGKDGQVQGLAVSGWDNGRKEWLQLWSDKDGIVTIYRGGPAADGTFVLTSDPKGSGRRWRYTYRNIQPNGIDAEYAYREGAAGPWTTVWSGHFDRIHQ